MPPRSITLTLIGNGGCHLCDIAEATVSRVLADLAHSDDKLDVVLNKKNLSDHPELAASYATTIPVILINDKPFSVWHVDADELAQTLRKEQYL